MDTLQVNGRSTSFVSDSLLDRPKRPSIHTAITAGFSSAITPPLTPLSPYSAGGEHGQSQHTLFHNYLRALHDFDPRSNSSPDDDASQLTAKLKAGDLILVHCVHANGWADGTVLNTGERAWLPTNYCEGYDHPYLRNLLNAMTQFWDLLGAGEDANLSTFVRQDYIRGLIAGVRFLLERADCLHRDVPLVKAHVGVRRMRKGLLADLSSLVQLAKRLQETISEPFAGEVIHVLLEDLISKACKVVTRAVSFVDVWTKETSTGHDDLNWLIVPQTANNEHQQTTQNLKEQPLKLNVDTSSFSTGELLSAVDSAKAFNDTQSTESPHVASPSQEISLEQRPESTIKDKAPRLSAVFRPAGTVAHRLSLIRRDPAAVVLAPFASEQLAKAHDICISHIGAFIGLHLQSRPCSELAATTERLVRACTNMIMIVDEVCAHDPHHAPGVQKAKTEFEAKVEELAKSTQAVFRFSDSPEDEDIMMPGQSSHLINVGTGLIRNTGECVVKTRQVIEQIGDFELKCWVVPPPGAVQNPSDPAITTPPAEPQSSYQDAPPSPSQKRFSTEKRFSLEKRLSKRLPPPPPGAPQPPPSLLTTTQAPELVAESPVDALETPITPGTVTSRSSLPAPPAPLVSRHRSATRVSQVSNNPADALRSPRSMRSDSISPARKDSIGMSVAGSTDTFASSSARDSSVTARSQGSTRATTPDQTRDSPKQDATAISSFASVSDLRSLITEETIDPESTLLQKTYANELTLNKDGQVSGGSLPALVEQLTTSDSAPDPVFMASFFMTFRKFCEPLEFAQALIARYDYIGDSRTVGTPVRLRIFNVFKQWLEAYWHADADKDALDEIRSFATNRLKLHLPAAGDRLFELTRRLTTGYREGSISGPPSSGMGKIIMSMGSQSESDLHAPEPTISKSQLNALRANNGSGASITDFDAMELARQITVLTMRSFCEVRADELLSMDWGKSNTTKAQNVRNMCLLNTDLANFVGDTILGPDDAKKRAAVIKQWAKIGAACLELNNYDSVMSIMASINSSVVQRLKRTWEVVSKKTKARIEELDAVCDMSKNYSALRQRLAIPMTPCLPFLGIYLTDLTFVIAGNPKRRELPGSTTESGEPLSVINFDMYMKISRIITHLQSFQVPYKLKEVPELQSWIEGHMQRMREGHDQLVGSFHRRSLFIEPKQPDAMAAAGSRKQSVVAQQIETAPTAAAADERPKTAGGDKTEKTGNILRAESLRGAHFDFFKTGAFTSLTRSSSRHDLVTIADNE